MRPGASDTRDVVVLAAGACAWIWIALAFGRTWPAATVVFATELTALGLSVHYTERRPANRRRLGYAAIIASSVVLLASVLVLVWALLMASLSTLTPP